MCHLLPVHHSEWHFWPGRRSKYNIRTPVALLRSLSDKYSWEMNEPSYPPSYVLNSTATVLLIYTQECCEQYWTSPGGNTPQGTNYTATCLPSRKISKLLEPDMQDTAGEAGTSSWMMYSYRPPHMAGQKQDDQLEYT